MALASCSADEGKIVDTKNVVWREQGVYWGDETNHIKAGLLLKYSLNTTNQTLVQITPLIFNGSISNMTPVCFGDKMFLWLPPLASRYQLTLLDGNGMPVTKSSKGRSLGEPLDVNPKPPRPANPFGPIMGSLQNPFRDPGYRVCYVKLNATNQITYYDRPTAEEFPETFVLQDLFKITAAGKYRLKFELRALKPKFGMTTVNLQPYYLPVNVEIEILKP